MAAPSGHQKTKCSAATRSGAPCRAWAMPDTNPPLCSIHAGRTLGGAPPGNRNAVSHGYYASSDLDNCDPPTIDAIIADLAARQSQLSVLIDQCLDKTDPVLDSLVTLLKLHGQNASRLGRLLRDRQALSGQAADGIAGAIAAALDELSTIWGFPL